MFGCQHFQTDFSATETLASPLERKEKIFKKTA
jgi:hypothetical protein